MSLSVEGGSGAAGAYFCGGDCGGVSVLKELRVYVGAVTVGENTLEEAATCPVSRYKCRVVAIPSCVCVLRAVI
jgi:hypothetical protein